MPEAYDRLTEVLTENEKLRSHIRLLEMQLQSERRINQALSLRLQALQDEQPAVECHQ